MNFSLKNILLVLGASLSVVVWYSSARATQLNRHQNKKPSQAYLPPEDSLKPKKKKNSRSEKYISDRYGDPFSNKGKSSPLLLGNPANIATQVELDSNQENFTIREKVGELDYRTPSTMSFEEYQKYQDRESIKGYWRNKQSGGVAGSKEGVNIKNALKSLRIPIKGLEGPFGSNYVDIKPNGLVTLDFSGRFQRVNNPIIPVPQQRNGSFEFDQQISLNLVGKIGEKLKLTANWDTKAAFEFQNNIKLEYSGLETDILQKIEAGFVNMPVNSSLITGAQNLFGIKTKLQFGRMSVTALMSSQRGKVDEIRMPAGSQARDFEIRADNYEENRHFFLGQFFRENYERAMKGYPALTSGVKVTRVNVFVTNRVNNTQFNKNVVAYMDLGETQPYRSYLKIANNNIIGPNNDSTANFLTAGEALGKKIDVLRNTTDRRDPTILPQAVRNDILTNFPEAACDTCLQEGADYLVVTSARMLQPNEYQFNPDLGYISLNSPVTAQDMLAVSYEYSYTDSLGNSQRLKVGEVVGDQQISDTSKTSKCVVLKLLKPVGVFTKLPTWDLMMKNIYSLGATQITRENFLLRVIYKDDRTGLDVPFLQDLEKNQRITLIKALGVDRLGPNNDPPADGNFDYVEGLTIDPKFGRIIFPVLEPFGTHMRDVVLAGEPQQILDKYVFTELYRRQVKADVAFLANKNKFFLKGRMQSNSSSDIMLQGVNIAQGSVQVYAGSNLLTEGNDYTVDYQGGRVKILNQGILASGQEIRVKFEKQDLFNFRRKTFLGTRFDYKLNNDVNFGGTFLHQTESPQITRTNFGDEPSSNSIWGLDANFKKESRFITKMLDKLPFLETKEPTQITFAGEVAQLIPGHPKVISKGERGTAFVDDFEGAETPFDLTNQPTNRWKLSSMPKINNPQLNSTELAILDREFNIGNNNLDYGFHRAKMAWYNIDLAFYRTSQSNVPASITAQDKENIFVRAIQFQDIFPNFDNFQLQTNLNTLDLAYFPQDRGPYNFNRQIQSNGKLGYNPRMSWAGITRELTNDIDFDNANIQYIEFWMMNPFYGVEKNNDPKFKIPINLLATDASADGDNKNKVPDRVRSAGKMYINLGEISEDVIKDGNNMFENGLPYDDATRSKAPARPSVWGNSPTAQFITNAFPAIPGVRALQDVGLDGLSNAEEALKFQDFLSSLNVTDPVIRNAILADPAADDFKYYLGDEADAQNKSILQRYLDFCGTENNSPESTVNAFTPANSFTPDMEDLNKDNTLNTTNSYYEYEVDVNPNSMQVGNNYIIAKQTDKQGIEYFQYRIPIRGQSNKVGNIDGFKSIRFIRVYLTGFQEPIILRMAKFQLVANQWRVYNENQNTVPIGETSLPRQDLVNVSTVNVEENSNGIPNVTTGYQSPPNFGRDQDITTQNNRRLNEQSLRLCVEEESGTELRAGRSASVFKNVNVDMLNYGRLRMFVHAESRMPEEQRKNLKAYMRLGTDYTENYYEIELPLTFTDLGIQLPTAEEVWPAANNLNINLKALPELKSRRNGLGGSFNVPYSDLVDGRKVTVKGNPDLSSVQVIMLGLRNEGPSQSLIGCIWVNELRLTDFVEEGGWATTGRMNVKLADVANLAGTMRFTGVGFGSIDQKVSQRQRVNTLDWGVQANMGIDRFLPQKAGLRLPLFASYNTRVISPRYNPLDPDVLLTTSLRNIPDPAKREAYRKLIVDEQIIKSINLTNVQKVKTRPDAKSHFYDVENLTLSVGYNITTRTNSSIHDFYNKIYTGGIGYTFNNPAKPFEPFKKMEKIKSPWFKLIKDINFSFLPTSITFRTDLNRRLSKTQFFEGNPLDGFLQDPFYEKAFSFVRTYGLVWAFTKSLTLNFTANTNAIIDEPFGTPDTAGYNKQLWANVKRLGRTKNYNHSVTATYKVPFDKLPITEFISADLSYNGTYNWVAGANGQRELNGNLVSQNTRDMSVNGNISLDRLYNKSKFLREALNPPPKEDKKKKNALDPKTEKADTTKKEPPKAELRGLKEALRVLMSMKRVSGTYKLTEGTKLPGYKGTANILGLDRDQGSDIMLPFVLGWQDYTILDRLAARNLISTNPLLTDQFTYTRRESISAQTTLDPIKDFNVTLKLNREKTSNYSELFHFNKGLGEFETSNPIITGNYNISMIFIKTAFKGGVGGSDDPTSSATFQEFEQNREIIRQRKVAESEVLDTTFLGRNTQDVLVPSFLASYRGVDINKASLNPFPQIPLPNWGINYTGLNKLAFLKKRFQSINITHAYNGSFGVSTFSSSNLYGSDRIRPGGDPSTLPQPTITKNGNYVPVYTMDVVTIKESFAPLIGINIRTKGKASFNIQYVKDRGLMLSMTNAQVQETKSQGVTFGFGWNKTGLKLPFKWQGRQIPPLKNEATFKLDITVRDNLTVQRNINGASNITAGNITLQIRPTISYMISQRVTMMFYFDRNVNIPRISSQFRRGVTQFGIQLRFTLS